MKIIPLLLFFVIAFFLWQGLSHDPRALPSVQIGRILPEFKLPTLNGQGFLSNQQFKKQWSVINVWASWCNACLEEQVFLLQLAREGTLLYGLNYKDTPKAATQWLAEWGNPYQQIGIDKSGRVAMDLGVYGAPETFLVNPQGIICARFAGILTPAQWQREFAPRLRGELPCAT